MYIYIWYEFINRTINILIFYIYSYFGCFLFNIYIFNLLFNFGISVIFRDLKERYIATSFIIIELHSFFFFKMIRF